MSKTLTIGNIYRPPKILNEHINAFITEFSSVAESLGDSNNEFIFAGDFNINLLNFFKMIMKFIAIFWIH